MSDRIDVGSSSLVCSSAFPGYAATASEIVPSDDTGPVFAEPWQAQAFAMVCLLHEAGAFTWSEWTQCLAEKLNEPVSALNSAGAADRFYDHWLDALESIICLKGLTDVNTVAVVNAAWAAAALRTPHGSPIELAAVPAAETPK